MNGREKAAAVESIALGAGSVLAKEDTYLAHSMDAIKNDMASYDENAKHVLADKQVLARILKYTMEEFKDMPIDGILSHMGEKIEVGTRPLLPGPDRYGSVLRTETEDSVPGEGKIFFDIRFSVFTDREMKILINVEAQRTSDAPQLKYHIENRIVFYLARMISGQKNSEFFGSDYDSLRPVRSIWICFDGKKDDDAIEEIYLGRKAVFGKARSGGNLDGIKGYVIRIRLEPVVERSKNRLIAMLEELFSQKDVKDKKEILKNEYGMIMETETERRLMNMCNVSLAVWDTAIEQGIRRGIEQGIEQGKRETAGKMIRRGKLSLEEIAEDTGLPFETVRHLKEEILQSVSFGAVRADNNVNLKR